MEYTLLSLSTVQQQQPYYSHDDSMPIPMLAAWPGVGNGDPIVYQHTWTPYVPVPARSPPPIIDIASLDTAGYEETHGNDTHTTPVVVHIDAAPAPPAPADKPRDYCRWRGGCGELIYTDRPSVARHLRTAHGLDLRKTAGQVQCAWPGCRAGPMNASSVARHVSSALGHLSGKVHGCGVCTRTGFYRKDMLDRHIRECAWRNPARRKWVSARQDGICTFV